MRKIIQNALFEDLGSGDVTTNWIIPKDLQLKGTLLAKANGIIAGLEVFVSVFKFIDEKVEIDFQINDGEKVEKGTMIANVSGSGRALLSGERVALNLLQRMSGIATQTNLFVSVVKGTKTKILDTRKTVPGLRVLDKMAVQIGGGLNHRFGLFDMVLIKDNHISAAGSITKAVERVRVKNKNKLKIEVEVKNQSELNEAIGLNVDRILLDNMTIEEMCEAVKITDGRIPLEASGNITLENVRAIAETGVDFISSGMLTHSVKALDISFLIED
ncbi:MAG: carboxylating nicotinate-nucleotide diphosphorylase [Calditrichaceae bacterium]|nr:carboxylating nicotinate-nucleotide diphosphorylase [Calditrichaceae bacterium]